MDDAAFGTSRPRARPDGGAPMSRQAGSRHGVQDPRPGGNQAAQGALLSGTSRCRVRAEVAEVLCVYREVQVLKRAAAKSRKAIKRVAIVSYDEKPGIQAIATTAPDLPPKPGVHATFARDYEYKRHGTLSLLAGIDLLTGKVHALVRDRHRSREFIEFL